MLLLVVGFALVSMVMGDYCDTDTVDVGGFAPVPFTLPEIEVIHQMFDLNVPQICENPVKLVVTACEKHKPAPEVLALNLRQARITRQRPTYPPVPGKVYTTVWCDPPYPHYPLLSGDHQLVAKARE